MHDIYLHGLFLDFVHSLSQNLSNMKFNVCFITYSKYRVPSNRYMGVYISYMSIAQDLQDFVIDQPHPSARLSCILEVSSIPVVSPY